MTTHKARDAKKLVLLYGPPAVGKLTVSKELTQHLSAILFHNHLIFDVVANLLPPDCSFEDCKRFTCRLRLSAMELLLECDDRVVVTTFCYRGIDDDWYIDALKVLCQKYQTIPYFVQLTAANEHLLDRAENEDRRAFRKVNSRTCLEDILRNNNNYAASIHAINHICLDTSTLAPWRAALMLMDWINGRQEL
ncbi:AAA family ATPase [Pseudomonas savastanoi pv. phaseolicola]|uniref:Uncharacterized protein n=5 Tax=Pseudomonas savastanoi TaxID=29438 RepID=A0A0P9SIR5_PSESG|nr:MULTISPECIES: AAA family ATPase [Pseudomonas]AAZ38020.1 hypothetical conserved protein, putative [Pseudomonas savastanoi pv. phaseolicola 1448A]EFW77241.1 hypothetical protein PsgB076_29555 [Pseudomonas savastanoi pv. glycinea str. B076]EFW82953.1 hypothetical protein PsgRace4_27145 [Pseudomonas savastanoi pv. glycinea str. race 4]EGH16716.1 hypothetical protein Pgy4_27150 [Pseudomonas savastanoi pv. glycinea str. race 4]KPX42649.1 hypothetical protein ALO37_02489 [Pseudomonas savastanoi pv